MSLRGFHIVFITIATLLLGGLSAWGFMEQSGGIGMKVFGLAMGLLAILMVVYGVYFYKKASKLII